MERSMLWGNGGVTFRLSCLRSPTVGEGAGATLQPHTAAYPGNSQVQPLQVPAGTWRMMILVGTAHPLLAQT
jgi:hypothetical protein